VTHDEVVFAIQSRARARGVLTHYCKRGERCLGDRGAPDLLLAGTHHAGWIEVKTPACPTLSSAQVQWRYQLLAAGQLYEVMQESDLEPGHAVDLFLGFLTTGEAVAA